MSFDFYELLDAIRLRPAMYLSEPSITALYNFINGYSFHNEARFEIQKGTDPPFPEFHNWTAMRLGFKESTSGWCKMLLKVKNGDEEKAFQRFFVLLDEFRGRQARVVRRAELPPDQHRKTKFIQIVKYTDDEGVFLQYVGNNNEIIEEYFWGNLENTLWLVENQIGKLDWQVVQ
jgi:hypothetical protein